MNSIRKKLFFQIGMLIGILILLSIMANTFFFRYYHESNMKKKLQELYLDISAISPEAYDGSELKNIEMIGGLDIQIFDKKGNLVYTTRNFDSKSKEHMISKEKIYSSPDKFLPPSASILKQTQVDDYVQMLWVDDRKVRMKNIYVIGEMENGYTINMRVPLMPLEQGVDQANVFVLYVGFLMLPIGMIFAYFLSKSFTEPILEINKKAEKLKRLDFDNKCNVCSSDEIGELAQSINEMSGELARTIESLSRSNEELQIEIIENEELHERRKKLLNNVSHELKTPLALIQGYAEGLQMNVAEDKERRDFYCHVIKDEANKMNMLIRNLLDVNQLESGEEIINRSDFKIAELLAFVTEKYVHKFEKFNIVLEIDPEDNSTVWGDREKIEQVITNFLNNAIQYSNDNKRIKVSLNREEEFSVISVYNTCEYIDDEELPRIWDSFYKVNKSRSRELGGYGLGLSIVKGILEAHGYEFGVRRLQDGIEFWVKIKNEN